MGNGILPLLFLVTLLEIVLQRKPGSWILGRMYAPGGTAKQGVSPAYFSFDLIHFIWGKGNRGAIIAVDGLNAQFIHIYADSQRPSLSPRWAQALGV